MTRTRRHFTAEQKATAVRRHLAGKEAVSDLADELGVQPSQIHVWVKQVLDQAEKAFQRPQAKRALQEQKERKIKLLEEKLAVKNEVISELMEENVKSKKASGEL
ncbi:transposase [Candidatus Woesearchaeota archaeon]|nr:MAG: transposase [Candidatus Woesearchaeota archaeon]